jgi:hypothetical protein
VNGSEVLFYKPTPSTCDTCHGAGIPKMTKISFLNVSKVPNRAIAALNY